MAAKQKDAVGASDEAWDLIAHVKSQKSNFDLNLVLMERMRSLKDACDWVESMASDGADVNLGRARRLVHERLKAAEVQVKKNVEGKLKEMHESKRQTASNPKGAENSKCTKFVNSRLSHPKNPDCERCSKKRSQGKMKSRVPIVHHSTTAFVPRHVKGLSKPEMSHQLPTTNGNFSATVSTPAKTTRIPTAVQKQLAQSLKEKLKARCQLPKVTLLSHTQKNNVPTSTRATNTGSCDGDDRVCVENVIHVDEGAERFPSREPSRALSVRLLPGVSVPTAESSQSMASIGRLSPDILRVPSDELSQKNTGQFDFWSAAETGVPDYQFFNGHPEKNTIFRPISPDKKIGDEDHDWLVATRQWLEQELVDVVLSRLRLDDSPSLRTETRSSTGSGQSVVQSNPSKEFQNSDTSIAVEEYTDTFENSENLENSVKDIRLPSASLSATQLGSFGIRDRTSSLSGHPEDDSADIRRLQKADSSGSRLSTLSKDLNNSQSTDRNLESRHDGRYADDFLDQDAQSQRQHRFEDPKVLEDEDSVQQMVSNSSMSAQTSEPSGASPETQTDPASISRDISQDRLQPSISSDLLVANHQPPNEDVGSGPKETKFAIIVSVASSAKQDSVLKHLKGFDSDEDSHFNAEPRLTETSLSILEEIGTRDSNDNSRLHDRNFKTPEVDNFETPSKDCQPQGHESSIPDHEISTKNTNVGNADNLESTNKKTVQKSHKYLVSPSPFETPTMDPTATASKETLDSLSTMSDIDDMYSLGEVISTRKLRHVAFNRMNRKRRNPEMTSELSTASTLDGTVTDLEIDSDLLGVSSPTVWSEGEVRLDPLLGTVLSRTGLTKVPTKTSLGEVSDLFHTSRHSRESPQGDNSETNSDVVDSGSGTSASEPPTSQNRSPGELD